MFDIDKRAEELILARVRHTPGIRLMIVLRSVAITLKGELQRAGQPIEVNLVAVVWFAHNRLVNARKTKLTKAGRLEPYG